MAVVKTQKKQNLAVRAVALAKQIVELEEEMNLIGRQHVKDGITYSAGDFDGLQSLQHIDPAEMSTLLSGFAGIRSFLNEAGQFRMDIFEKVSDGA